jgi:hypothetical protein
MESEVAEHSFLTSRLVGTESSALYTTCFTTGHTVTVPSGQEVEWVPEQPECHLVEKRTTAVLFCHYDLKTIL